MVVFHGSVSDDDQRDQRVAAAADADADEHQPVGAQPAAGWPARRPARTCPARRRRGGGHHPEAAPGKQHDREHRADARTARDAEQARLGERVAARRPARWCRRGRARRRPSSAASTRGVRWSSTNDTCRPLTPRTSWRRHRAAARWSPSSKPATSGAREAATSTVDHGHARTRRRGRARRPPAVRARRAGVAQPAGQPDQHDRAEQRGDDAGRDRRRRAAPGTSQPQQRRRRRAPRRAPASAASGRSSTVPVEAGHAAARPAAR